MITEREQIRDQSLEAKQVEILRGLFPFQSPPQELVAGSYVIVDPKYQLRTALHQTNSSILCAPRTDGNLIVPAVGLNRECPTFDLSFMGREVLPETHEGGRRFASWWGAKPLRHPWRNEAIYTPERGSSYLSIGAEIRQIYDQILQGQKVDSERLGELLGNFISGAWYRHYTYELPSRIIDGDGSAIREGQQVFSGYEESVKEASTKFWALPDGDRVLLTDAFNFTIKARFKDPILYIDNDIPQLLGNDTERPATDYRSPHEIVCNTRGVTPDEVETVYFPDEMQGVPAEAAATNRLQAMGIGKEKIRRISELGEHYDNCQLRYGKFTADDLVGLIRAGSFVHIFGAGQTLQ